jgi:hemoglobin
MNEALGDTATWRNLAGAFYSRVNQDPLLRPLFPGKTLRCATEEFTAFLVQFFGGPSDGGSTNDAQRRWWLSLHESHARFKIGRKERAAWMKNMIQALDAAELEEPLRRALREFFERSSAYVVNSGPTPHPPNVPLHHDIEWRWDAQRALDESIAAIRKGETEQAISIAESDILRTRFEHDRSLLAGLLARMIRSRNPVLLSYVQERLSADPTLVRERYASRTLLHEAASQGDLPTVELLLRLGADPNATTVGGHTPLYCLANEYQGSQGGSIVHALAQSGANIDANDGVKRCTPLHMAARRGNLEVAEALLDCGAQIDARDSLRDSPLRRAVNCEKPQVASLLLERGADLHSIGNKGLTPLLAARTSAMKAILRSSST